MLPGAHLGTVTAENDFPLWHGCPFWNNDLNQIHILLFIDHCLDFFYKLGLKTSYIKCDILQLQPRLTAFCKVHTEHQTTRCLHPGPVFIHFFLSLCPLPPLLASISFPVLLGIGRGFTFQPRHATCHSREHRHTRIPECGARGMWHLFSLRWAPRVLDLIYIVSVHYLGVCGGWGVDCVTRGHCR